MSKRVNRKYFLLNAYDTVLKYEIKKENDILLFGKEYNKRADKVTILTKVAIKVDESYCLCYIKRKKKTNETTRILISF